ncbi:2-octaprenyl-6-methoxyphenol hydroxylase UbiH [Methyloglobulus morosus KoM1]|uniref:2-octaprenyl-6-methoxyphenol hydroxylase UbiH n=1 Tax=Methyloglobulus morosus KoM1 TaxID=1116472 RepID=V5C578_9GAMM|nr:2-octaprenyl-6-methoxyphenyl hydroxylase [Methyloglobulus morosus]ESS71883.1 2-octaprenyl-6-methoxyphenol hydroxylase UbiH [Methyloglobulus morosus KoM1]
MPLDGQNFDIIIVGGGLAGNCLALALGGSGLKIAVIEANTREQLLNSAMGDRALALAAGTIATLEGLGIWQGIEAKATAITDIHVSDKGHFGKVRLSARKQNVAALGYVITARDIESHVAELVDQTQITQIRPARLVGLMSDNHAVNVSIKHNDDSLCCSAKLLVGADGGNSSVRKLLDIPQQVTEYGQTALVTTVKTTLPHRNVAYERFTKSGPLAFLPIGKNQCSVVWTRTCEDADALMSGGENDFLERLQQCFGYRLGQLTLTAPRRAFPVSLVRAERMQSGRAVIVGNAVHQLHPVAGQGFNLGLRDVVQLVDGLLKHHGLGEDIGSATFLDDYVTAREQDHRNTIAFTDTLVKLFSNDWLAFAAARNIGLVALDHIPVAKALLSRHAMGLAQRLPKLGNRIQRDG